MKSVTFKKLASLVYDSISAQAKRDAERDKRDAERDKRDAERDKRDAERYARYAKLEEERLAREAEWKAQREKDQADYEKRWKRLERELGRLGNSYGEQVEAMFVNLSDKFNELGHNFPDMADYGYTYKGVAQVDRLYENGDAIMAVEVKSKLRQDHIDDHIERLKKISALLKSRGDNRKVLGAVAGGIVSDQLTDYAHKRGLYVLKQNGESISIVKPPENFKLTEWKP